MNAIDEYLAKLPDSQRIDLERVRKIVHSSVADCEEVISYGLPTIKYKKKNLIHFGAFKDHMSLFPTSQPIGDLKAKLADFTVSKGTIQFTHDKQVPEVLIQELVQIRKNSIDTHQ